VPMDGGTTGLLAIPNRHIEFRLGGLLSTPSAPEANMHYAGNRQIVKARGRKRDGRIVLATSSTVPDSINKIEWQQNGEIFQRLRGW